MRLTLDAVDAGYDGGRVLERVSLCAPTGAVTALLGANGAGKTTALRVASGLLAPSAGRVWLDDADVTGSTAEQLAARGVCHIPEGRGVFPELTVRENLALFAAPHGDGDPADRAVEAFPALRDHLDRPAGRLSGGQQQMVAVSRAALRRAPLVLLDEVSMGLAPRVVDDIFEFLETLVADGAAVLLVEQFVSRALALADYVYLLNRGVIVLAGDASELQDEDLAGRYLGVA
jgi:branched-chain amino acid transport system ATP-binding protein